MATSFASPFDAGSTYYGSISATSIHLNGKLTLPQLRLFELYFLGQKQYDYLTWLVILLRNLMPSMLLGKQRMLIFFFCYRIVLSQWFNGVLRSSYPTKIVWHHAQICLMVLIICVELIIFIKPIFLLLLVIILWRIIMPSSILLWAQHSPAYLRSYSGFATPKEAHACGSVFVWLAFVVWSCCPVVVVSRYSAAFINLLFQC